MLGVGGAILALPAVAGAETGADSSPSATDTSDRGQGSGGAVASRAARGGAAHRVRQSAPVGSESAPVSDTERTERGSTRLTRAGGQGGTGSDDIRQAGFDAPDVTIDSSRTALSVADALPASTSEPGNPAAAPVAWAVAAAARRELTGAENSALTSSTPAAAQVVGSPADVAGLATDLSVRVTDALADIAGGLGGSAGATLVEFLSRPTSTAGVSVGEAAGIAAANLVRSLVGIPTVSVPSIDGAVDADVIDAAIAALSDPALSGGLGTAARQLISDLAGDAGVRALVGGGVSQIVSAFGGGMIGAEAASALGDAAATLLADPTVVAGLGAVAGSAISNLLGQPAVVAVLADAVQGVGDAALAGGSLSASLTGAVQGLLWSVQHDAALAEAVGAALTGTLNTAGDELLGNAAIQQLLGQTATTLFGELAADPGVRTVLAQQLSGILGTQAAALLNDPTVATDVAGALGTAVTAFLGQPGVVDALTGAAGQVLQEIIGGADPGIALQAVFAAVQADPAFATALGATISTFVESVMNSAVVLEIVGGASENLVTEVLDQVGLGSTPAGELAKSALTSLLDDASVADLIGDIAADVLSGKPVEALAGNVIRAIVTEPELQSAVGTAIGEAVGALFGDNPIGDIVGWAAGGAATLVIGFLAGIALLFNLVPPAAESTSPIVWPIAVVA